MCSSNPCLSLRGPLPLLVLALVLHQGNKFFHVKRAAITVATIAVTFATNRLPHTDAPPTQEEDNACVGAKRKEA